ncbi:MAG: ImmA/IrrE family metallo-endopeptidase [Promicromonosporaceae bacterium]|nr:ImmA/IrrE family metallo-endopeptidase [Promicromonosporaceae bacterium]
MKFDQAVTIALGSIDPEGRSALALDPLAALQDMGITVKPVQTLGGDDVRGDGGTCDGMSFLQDGVILYAPSPASRRENFTLAHEYGHFLVSEQEDILDWLGDLPNPHRALETVCDQIASELLLPKSLIDAVVQGGVPRAAHLGALYDLSQASEPCCAIALANRLKVMGAVVIAERHIHTVRHASIRPGPGDEWPNVYPWKGEMLPPGRVRLPLGHSDYKGYITWTDGFGRTAGYFADATATDTRVHLILAENDLWNSEDFHVRPTVEADQRPVRTITCCGQNKAVRGWPCAKCGEPDCPICHKCGCERAIEKEKVCSRCWMSKNANLVNADGVCADCQ